jgi:hypothetical protein
MHRRNGVDKWSDEAQSARPSIAMTDLMRDREWKRRDATNEIRMLDHEMHYQAKGVGDGTTGTSDAERTVPHVLTSVQK